MAEDETRPKRPAPAFKEANPGEFAKLSHDTPAMRQLAVVEGRVGQTKERASAHFRKFQALWVSKEAIKLWTRDLATPAAQALAPKNAAQRTLTANEYMRQAKANVNARMIGRIQRINHIRAKMRNAIVNNANDPFLTRKFTRAAEPGSVAIRPKLRRSR